MFTRHNTTRKAHPAADSTQRRRVRRESPIRLSAISAPLRGLLLPVFALLATVAIARADSNGDQEKFFRDAVQPILVQHCFKCHSHSSGKANGGLVLDSRNGWAKGGDSGPAIVPGKPDDSLLIQAVRYGDLQMPPTGKLPPESIAILERWVMAGAADSRTNDTLDSRPPINIES